MLRWLHLVFWDLGVSGRGERSVKSEYESAIFFACGLERGSVGTIHGRSRTISAQYRAGISRSRPSACSRRGTHSRLVKSEPEDETLRWDRRSCGFSFVNWVHALDRRSRR